MTGQTDMNLLGKFKQTLRQARLIQGGDRILVALSGGPDSVALLCLLTEIRRDYGLDIRAAHINHKLRGIDSELDQRFVEEFCRSKKVALDVREAPIDYSDPGNTEDEARKQRYELLATLAAKHRSLVATAHTLDDQAETFLMRLCRGSGTGGLSGIYSERVHVSAGAKSCRIIRPLLFARKREVIDYLERENLKFRLDRSNADLELDRNWLRHRLIPMLEKRLNPELAPALARTAELMGEIEELMDSQAGIFCNENSSQEGADLLLHLAPLKAAHPALQKQIVRKMIRMRLGSLTGISMEHTQAILGLLDRQSGRRVHLPGGLWVIREFDQLRFSTEAPVGEFSYVMKIPGELVVPEVCKTIRIMSVSADEADQSCGLFLPVESVTIRNRRPGDTYLCHSRQGPVRLKDLFLKERIPFTERGKRLLLETNEGIKWVEGLPPESFQVANKSRKNCYEVVVLIETF